MRHTSWPNYRNFEFDRFSFSIKSKKLPDSRFKITGSPLTDSSLTDLTTGNYKEFLDYSTISFQRPLACKACSFFLAAVENHIRKMPEKCPKNTCSPNWTVQSKHLTRFGSDENVRPDISKYDWHDFYLVQWYQIFLGHVLSTESLAKSDSGVLITCEAINSLGKASRETQLQVSGKSTQFSFRLGLYIANYVLLYWR